MQLNQHAPVHLLRTPTQNWTGNRVQSKGVLRIAKYGAGPSKYWHSAFPLKPHHTSACPFSAQPKRRTDAENPHINR
jgi:hypothetical protein